MGTLADVKTASAIKAVVAITVVAAEVVSATSTSPPSRS